MYEVHHTKVVKAMRHQGFIISSHPHPASSKFDAKIPDGIENFDIEFGGGARRRQGGGG
jgi:hypothetical protein